MKTLRALVINTSITAAATLGSALVLTATVLLTTPSSHADEAALYDRAPAGSAFIRLVNLTSKSLTIKLGNQSLHSDRYCQASSYTYLANGEYRTSTASVQWHGQLKAGHAYTLAVSDTTAELFEQPLFDNARKGLFSVYNLSSESVSIATTRGQKPVFADLRSNGYIARQVNPIKIELSALQNNRAPQTVAPVIFQNNTDSSLFICEGNNQLVSSWANNR